MGGLHEVSKGHPPAEAIVATIRGLDVTRLLDQIDAALRTQGTPGHAEHEEAYLKSELEPCGMSVPAIRSVAKAVASQQLLPRAARASGVTIREAIKPLSERQRRAVLTAR